MLSVDRVLGNEKFVELVSLGEHDAWHAKEAKAYFVRKDIVWVKHFNHFDEDDVVGGFGRPVNETDDVCDRCERTRENHSLRLQFPHLKRSRDVLVDQKGKGKVKAVDTDVPETNVFDTAQ